jgi:hypothetical protein
MRARRFDLGVCFCVGRNAQLCAAASGVQDAEQHPMLACIGIASQQSLRTLWGRSFPSAPVEAKRVVHRRAKPAARSPAASDHRLFASDQAENVAAMLDVNEDNKKECQQREERGPYKQEIKRRERGGNETCQDE